MPKFRYEGKIRTLKIRNQPLWERTRERSSQTKSVTTTTNKQRTQQLKTE